MTPTTAAVMPVSGAVNLILPCVVSINGAPRKIKTKLGRNERRDDERACGAGEEEAVSAEDLFSPRADKADERDDYDQRTGCGLAERKAIDHLRGRQPLILFDAALVVLTAAQRKRRQK